MGGWRDSFAANIEETDALSFVERMMNLMIGGFRRLEIACSFDKGRLMGGSYNGFPA
jgi:hypothetical protein